MSAKEQIHKIPLSPSSPPEIGLKQHNLSDNSPELPLSPPLMSVATKSYVGCYEDSRHSEEMTTRSSPKSPAQSSTFTQQPVQHGSQPYSTPASSTKSIPGLNLIEENDQHRDKRQKVETGDIENEEQRESIGNHTHTNHDRSKEPQIEPDSTQVTDIVTEDRPSQLSHDAEYSLEDITLEQLQKDMGDAFLLCRSKVEQQKPNPQKHLLAAYNLSPLLRSVARNDPVTGEKINKLRKSYEGQIKGFGLAGRNKPVKTDRNVDDHEPGVLRRMAGILPEGIVPEDHWQEQNAKISIEVTPEISAKLRQAAELQPGTVRNNAHWEDVLGHEKNKPILPQPSNNTPVVISQPVLNGVSFTRGTNGSNTEPKRQTRGKKRSYGDDSFVGYGEGYSDTEGPDADYGDGDGGIRRKRKKDSFGAQVTYGQYINSR